MRDETPQISVIVPVYNAEAYLRQCVDSILGQTLRSLEVILVDDGSTDASGRICGEYAAADGRVKLLRRPHEGVVPARNAGAAAASGTYVACVDSDDWIEPDLYEGLMASMGERSPDVLMFGFRREYPEKTVFCRYGVPTGYYDMDGMREEIYPRLLRSRLPYQMELPREHPGTGGGGAADRLRGPRRQERQMEIYAGMWSKLTKRELFRQACRMVPEKLYAGEDMAFTVHALLRARSAMVCEQTPYHYRIRPGSLARRAIPWEQHRLLFDSLYKALRDWPLAEECIPRLYRFMFDKVLLGRYERFLTGPFSGVLFGDLEGRRAALYGAGAFGREICRKTAEVFPERIVLWVDRNWEEHQKAGLPVEPVEALLEREYDVILVALVDGDRCEEIRRNLTAMGIAGEKIRCAAASPEALRAVEEILREETVRGKPALPDGGPAEPPAAGSRE